MNCARSAPPDSGHFLLGKCVLSSLNAKFSPLRGPESALRAARYAGRATRAGVLRTAREADTCGPIQLMKPSPSYTHTAAPVSGPRAVTLGGDGEYRPVGRRVFYCELCSADGSSPWS